MLDDGKSSAASGMQVHFVQAETVASDLGFPVSAFAVPSSSEYPSQPKPAHAARAGNEVLYGNRC